MTEPELKLVDILAIDRTRMAAERSLMAWVRTALSMITFGFTFYKFMLGLGLHRGLSSRAPRPAYLRECDRRLRPLRLTDYDRTYMTNVISWRSDQQMSRGTQLCLERGKQQRETACSRSR